VLPLSHGKEVRRWALFASAACYMLAWLFPRILSPFNRLWAQFGTLIAKVTNPIMMAALFYSIFTPVALLLRLQRKDPLRLRWDADAETYWIPRTPPGPAADSMSKQF
jgi:saxitoxin biosynthesis operon SxtJ-like protein